MPTSSAPIDSCFVNRRSWNWWAQPTLRCAPSSNVVRRFAILHAFCSDSAIPHAVSHCINRKPLLARIDAPGNRGMMEPMNATTIVINTSRADFVRGVERSETHHLAIMQMVRFAKALNAPSETQGFSQRSAAALRSFGTFLALLCGFFALLWLQFRAPMANSREIRIGAQKSTRKRIRNFWKP